MKKLRKKNPTKFTGYKYPCTNCKGNAFIGYVANKPGDWDGKLKVGERLCLACGKLRGINFF